MMEHQPAHAYGVDNAACSFHSHKNTPSAWMIALISLLFPSPVPRVGYFSHALLVYSWQAPKHRAGDQERDAESPTITYPPLLMFQLNAREDSGLF